MHVLTTTILLLCTLINSLHSACETSYITICDSFDDLGKHSQNDWSELMVKTSNLSTLSEFDSKWFKHPSHLYQIFVIAGLNNVKTDTLKSFSNLYYLNFYGNHLATIRSYTFSDLKLKLLKLRNNKIETIAINAFANSQIETLDLSFNKLTQLRENSLQMKSLTSLFLSHNSLHYVASKSLPNELKSLSLDYNVLEIIDKNNFENLEVLENLNLSHNALDGITKATGMGHLHTLDLSHNNIQGIEADSFGNFSELEELYLGWNHLTYISEKIFPFPNSIKKFDISYNRLTYLSGEVGAKLRNLSELRMFGNPWNCACFVQIEGFLQTNKVSRNECEREIYAKGQVPLCIVYGSDCSGSEVATDRQMETYRNLTQIATC